MRTVITVNSTYEINEADHMIRRLHGVNDPTERQGARVTDDRGGFIHTTAG